MKMVKHMALPFVTICALVSVTVMAYEANYAGNPVTVTNGWDSRQYIATSILRIDSDSVGANVGAGIEVVAKDKNTILKSYIRAEPRLYLDGELWLAEGWHYSDGTQNGLYTESSTYFISRWGEVFAQSEFGTYKGSRGYEDYTAPATAKINLGNIKGNLSATENNKVRVNSNGQTYGPGWVDDTPELIAAVGAGGVKGYEANYGWKCDVGMRTLTYAQFRNQYAYIVKSFAHSFDGSAIKYDADYHKVKCSLSGCNGFIYGSHYAQSPGANATCLACGYKGNISIGIMSARDELL